MRVYLLNCQNSVGPKQCGLHRLLLQELWRSGTITCVTVARTDDVRKPKPICPPRIRNLVADFAIYTSLSLDCLDDLAIEAPCAARLVLAMNLPLRLAQRLRPLWSTSASTRALSATTRVAQDEQWPQRTPLGPYYDCIINTPAPPPISDKPPSSADPEVLPSDSKPEPAPAPTKKKPGRKPKNKTSTLANPTPSGSPTSDPPVPPHSATDDAAERARRVFGSPELKLQYEAERHAERKAQSTYLAGVMVPPRPEEPDNCCMSGCVNCVWDLYRDEIEEWSAKKNEAQVRMRQAAGSGKKSDMTPETKMNVEAGEAKIAKDLWDNDAFQSVPVGIREFMKLEKKLKSTHAEEGSSGS